MSAVPAKNSGDVIWEQEEVEERFCFEVPGDQWTMAGFSQFPEPQLLTIQEFSERTPLSVSQIRRLVKAGRIPYLQPGGPRGKLLFAPDALSQQRNETTTAQPVPPPPGSGRRPEWMNTSTPD